MKRYIVLSEVESSENEVIIKVEPLYCMENRTEDMFTAYLNEYTPTKGDKLYFLPGVNVPRIKLKDLALQHGIRTIRNIDEATHIFAARNTTDKITNAEWKYSMNLTDFNEMMNDPNMYMDERYRENIREALENYEEDRVLFNYSVYNDIRHGDNKTLVSYTANMNSSTYYNTIEDDYSDLCHKIIGSTVYDEMAILKHINGDDATIIDETMYEQIHQMFESRDNDNHILAMEIMANSNYAESLLYLEMLFKEHSHEISNSHTKNHVNFKSLIGYLNKNRGYLGTSLDQIVNSLCTKEVITKDMMDILMKRYSSEISEGGDSDHFRVKVITLSDELNAKLNINYAYQHVDDFVTEVSEDNSPGVEGVESDIEVSNEDIEEAFTRIERNELKSELIELEESTGVPESHANNNQIEEKNDTNFDWF
jgi:uncharacterized protein YlxP (DUF503 family)